MDTIGEWGRGYRALVEGNPWILLGNGGGATGALLWEATHGYYWRVGAGLQGH